MLPILVVCIFVGSASFRLLGCSGPKNSNEKMKGEKEGLKKANEPQNPSKPGETSNWEYTELQDRMGRGVNKVAITYSLNTVSFSPPYEGDQHGLLALRSLPGQGKDVMLGIEKGQFLTGIDGCRVTVRFDDDKPIAFWGTGTENLNTTKIFISQYSKFVKRLKRSKIVMIEAPFYQEGNQVFKFNVDSLKWDDK